MALSTACAAAFALGLYTVLVRRDFIAVLAGAEVMLGAANVQVLALAVARGVDPAVATAFSLIVLAMTAAEAAVGMALVVTAFRRTKRTRVEEYGEVRG